MKVLILDIENAPPVAEFWGDPWRPSIQVPFLRQPGWVLCVGYKWLGDRKVQVAGGPGVSQEEMLREVWDVLNEADVVVTYNGDKHDLPHLNTEFVIAHMGMPSPYISVDLYKTVRNRFHFLWGKLDYVVQQLGLGRKIKHEGHEMWQQVMADDPKAWAKMIRYCKQDVLLTESLHDELLGWIENYPNRHLYGQQRVAKNGNPTCPKCGKQSSKQGFRKARTRIYQQYQCDDGHWFRRVRTEAGTASEVTS